MSLFFWVPDGSIEDQGCSLPRVWGSDTVGIGAVSAGERTV